MKPIATVVTVLALVGLGIWYETVVWKECLQTNSWFYCMRILSK